MKVSEIITEAKQPVKRKKKIPKPKPRPKKNLWFGDKNHWHADLQFTRGGGFDLHHTAEENEEDKTYFATDPDAQLCYGVWQGKNKRGITFHKPRHMNVVKHPRTSLQKLEQSPPENNVIM